MQVTCEACNLLRVHACISSQTKVRLLLLKASFASAFACSADVESTVSVDSAICAQRPGSGQRGQEVSRWPSKWRTVELLGNGAVRCFLLSFDPKFFFVVSLALHLPRNRLALSDVLGPAPGRIWPTAARASAPMYLVWRPPNAGRGEGSSRISGHISVEPYLHSRRLLGRPSV